MSVLFSITYYSPYVSGLTLYCKRLAEALAKKDYQVTVISSQHDKKLPLRASESGVEVVRVPFWKKISKGFLMPAWISESFREVKKNDAVIINLPQFEGFITAFWGRVLGKKVISIYHCEVILPSGFFPKFVQFVLNFSNRLPLLFSDKIVTYTEDFAEYSKLLKNFRTKLQYVYPPIDGLKIDKRVQKVLLGKIGKKPDFLIGVAARLSAEKGIEYLLEAIPLLKEKFQISLRPELRARANFKFQIIIAGPLDPVGEESYKKKILDLAKSYQEEVIFLGSLKQEEMGAFYSLLDVLVLPSINSTEAFGMVQVEAMLMGVPVVATDLPGVRIPAQETGMGKVVPIKNSQKLAEAIVEVLINKKKYMISPDLIKQKFNLEKTVSFYEDLFSTSLLAQRSGEERAA